MRLDKIEAYGFIVISNAVISLSFSRFAHTAWLLSAFASFTWNG